MTRFLEPAPWARAMSARKAGAAKLTVNAATPSRMKSRRVTCMALSLLHELEFSGSEDEPRDARFLDGAHDELRGPRVSGVGVGGIQEPRRAQDVVDHRLHVRVLPEIHVHDLVEERRRRRRELADEEAPQLARQAPRGRRVPRER